VASDTEHGGKKGTDSDYADDNEARSVLHLPESLTPP
jgi:hypothetical protein